MSRTYTRELIDKISGVPGAVWIEFNEAAPEDMAKTATWIATLMNTRPLEDPLITVNEARAFMKMEPLEEQAEEVPIPDDAIEPEEAEAAV